MSRCACVCVWVCVGGGLVCLCVRVCLHKAHCARKQSRARSRASAWAACGLKLLYRK